MTEKEAIILNDDLFQKTISCPLKFYHILKGDSRGTPPGMLFRQRNKLHIRDAIAHLFQNSKHTSSGVTEAFKETESWLNESSVTICGAVIQVDNLLTRIPILVKDGDNLTIIQAHGKLRKRSDSNEIYSSVRKRSIARYLLKAAYRVEVISRKFPNFNINVHFYFPNKQFKSTSDNLHLFHKQNFEDDESIKLDFSALFSKVKATNAVDGIRKNIPEMVAHNSFVNMTVSEAIQKILSDSIGSENRSKLTRHPGCKYCEFRLSEQESCWDQFFLSEDIYHPDKHIFELIGQGNRVHLENDTFYQEEVELGKGLQSFEEMQNYGGSTITILHRRNLQILQAKDKQVPKLWIKPGAKSLDSLQYPLHFIDFEAATYALPMKRESGPYAQIYFQFSCHSLFKNGDLIHTEWLDQQDGDVYPHKEFVNQLGEIPNIFNGTIMQYSPFEKQGVNRLINEFRKDSEQFKKQIEILEEIRKSELPGRENRFFDLSRMIREYYFNHYFSDSLGLKQVLLSVLQWEQSFGEIEIPQIQNEEENVNITHHFIKEKIVDPYKDIQNEIFLINDGSAAMNAWLALKNGLLRDKENVLLPGILKKYCALDSFALVLVYRHLKKFVKMIDDDDLVRI